MSEPNTSTAFDAFLIHSDPIDYSDDEFTLNSHPVNDLNNALELAESLDFVQAAGGVQTRVFVGEGWLGGSRIE